MSRLQVQGVAQAQTGDAGGGGQAAPVMVMSRVRLALLMVVAVYPLITVLLYLIGPLTAGWAVWQRTLLLDPLMVVVIVFGITPLLHARFRRFLMVPAKV